MPSKTRAHIKIAVMVMVVGAAVCWVAGGAKKSEPEAVPEIHDTFTDTRDGKTYRTVVIGGKKWMAENLNYATPIGSWCYGNKPDSCNKYGRLYDWSAAMNIRSSYNSSKWSGSDEEYNGICPSGWHLPSNAEWTALVNYVESDRGTGSGTAAMYLKSTSGWYNGGNGADYYEFWALPGGGRYYSGGSFGNAGYYGYWWTATEYGSGNAYDRNVYYYYDGVDNDINSKENGFSVRCVRD